MNARSENNAIAHLSRDAWRASAAALTKKAIAELAHELLIEPALDGTQPPGQAWAQYRLPTSEPGIEYRFRARILDLDHWDIDQISLEKYANGALAPLDPLELILEFRGRLGISPETLPVYLEELTTTLYAGAYKRTRARPSSADLVFADFQEIESAMLEGHPSFLANYGRVGFDAEDYLLYSPESAAPFRLVWVAAARRYAEATTVRDLSYSELLREELGAELETFHAELRRRGRDPADYLLIPVHPWQWFNKLALIFAADLAAGDLVCLGYGADHYRAQQSLRTVFNVSRPRRCYVKMALSVINMGFMRGLSADYMRGTPAINEWIDDLLRSDPYFEEKGFSILREAAAVGYRKPHFEGTLPKSSAHRKMLAALWRESPVPRVAPGQRLMTMAALLHRDREGTALLPLLIERSGLNTDLWLDRYLDCYLAPLVHCFYRYDLAFMPHGENVILVLEKDAPLKAFLKDIAEEAIVMDLQREMPEAAQRLRAQIPEDIKALSIFTDVFDGILRYIAQILLEQGNYPTERFWGRVAACIARYQLDHPELSDRFRRYDLFAPEFQRSCLNRLQLRNNQQMVDLADPIKALQFIGILRNPIFAFRETAFRETAFREVSRP